MQPPDSADVRFVDQSFPPSLPRSRINPQSIEHAGLRDGRFTLYAVGSAYGLIVGVASQAVLGQSSRRAVTPHNCEPRFAGGRNRRWQSPVCFGSGNLIAHLLTGGKASILPVGVRGVSDQTDPLSFITLSRSLISVRAWPS